MPPASTSKLPPTSKRRWQAAPGEKAQLPTENANTASQSGFSFPTRTSKDKDRQQSQKMILPGLLKKERHKIVSQWEVNGELAKRQEAARSKKPGLGEMQCTLSFKDWMDRLPLGEGGNGGKA